MRDTVNEIPNCDSVRRETLDTGVVLLDAHGQARAATAAALAMLGCADVATLASRWGEAVRSSGVEPSRAAAEVERVAAHLGLSDEPEGRPSLSVEPVQESAAGESGHAVLVRRGGDAGGVPADIPGREMVDYQAVRMRNLAYLARSIGHELRTPLGGAMLQAGRLREMLQEVGGAEVGKADAGRMSSMAQMVQQALRTTRTDLEALTARLRGGEPGGDGEEFDLSAAVREAARWLRIAAMERGRSVDARLGEQTLLCRGTQDRLEHAVLGVAIVVLESLGSKGILVIELTPAEDRAELCLRGERAETGEDPGADVQTNRRTDQMDEVRVRHAGRTARAMGGAFTLEPGAQGSPEGRFVLPVQA